MFQRLYRFFSASEASTQAPQDRQPRAVGSPRPASFSLADVRKYDQCKDPEWRRAVEDLVNDMEQASTMPLAAPLQPQHVHKCRTEALNPRSNPPYPRTDECMKPFRQMSWDDVQGAPDTYDPLWLTVDHHARFDAADRTEAIFDTSVVGQRLTYTPADGMQPVHRALGRHAKRRKVSGPNETHEIVYYRCPLGPTGVVGNGQLWFYGPNHAADAVITRDTCSQAQLQHMTPTERFEQMDVLMIQRPDGTWAVPGGMNEDGVPFSLTLLQELAEEATTFKCLERVPLHILQELAPCFRGYMFRGPVDDSRNTDSAWMETHAGWFHLPCKSSSTSTSPSPSPTESSTHGSPIAFADCVAVGDTSEVRKAQWVRLSEAVTWNLFASHDVILQTTVQNVWKQWE